MLSDWMNVLAALPPSVELLVKLTALLTVAWIFKPLLSRANPRWQAFYWRGVAATAVLLPVVVVVGPTVPVPLLEGPQRQAVESRSAAPLQQAPDPRQALPGEAGVADAVVVTRETAVAGDIALTPRESEPSVAVQAHSATAHPGRWHGILAVAWLVPALFLLAGSLLSEWRTARLVRQAEKVPETTTQLLARVARSLKYGRTIRVRISSQVDSPLVTGWFRPSILLPEAFGDEGQTDLRGIFAHEVNHLASHDLVWSRVIQFLSIGLWFHPLAWGLGRQHLDACERASDAAAAEYVGDADAYAGTLARVALGVVGQRRALAGIAMARTPRIQQRLLRLGKGITATPLRRRQVIPVVAGGLILVTAVGGLRLVEASGPAPSHQAEPAEAAAQAIVGTQGPDAAEGEQAAAEPVTEYDCKLVDILTRAPVAGATVTVQRRISGGGKAFEQWPMKRETECNTGADGSYTVDIRAEEAAEPRLYIEIRTKHPEYVDYYGGYSYSMITKNLTMGTPPFFTSLGVWPAVKLTGTVVDPDGKPAAGVLVTCFSRFQLEGIHTRGYSTEGKTDQDGIFELNSARGGNSIVKLWPKDYSPSSRVVEPRLADLGKTALDYLQLDALVPVGLVEAVKTRDIGRLELEDGIEVQGRVVDVDGTPIEGVWVNASRRVHRDQFPDYSIQIARSALTDADGRYRMAPLAPGTYRVTPWEKPRDRSVEDRTPRPVPAEFLPPKVTLEEGTKIATVDFQAVPHTTMVVQYCRSSGEPCGGHEISFSGGGQQEFYWKRCRPDANGRIEFRAPIGLEKASLSLITNEHSSLRHRIGKDGPLRNEDRVELGTISSEMEEIAIIRYVAPILLIKAVDEEGELIEDAWVELKYAPNRAPLGDSEYLRHGRRAGHVSLSEQRDGRWRTSQLLPDEELTLTVKADGYEPTSKKLSLSEGETREIEVTLRVAARGERD